MGNLTYSNKSVMQSIRRLWATAQFIDVSRCASSPSRTPIDAKQCRRCAELEGTRACSGCSLEQLFGFRQNEMTHILRSLQSKIENIHEKYAMLFLFGWAMGDIL